ncbi:TusE/DsrC/DsvC family sulfur relay protein [candidate division KSB1 bacterium]|nr:TusE/DsrC/DsvC family sulfur relay protein [candidate division KSB1 bacterium]
MATKEIAGVQVELDDEGFMTNPEQWNEDIARALAAEEGITELTDKHWEIINFVRKDAKEKGQVPTIRRMNKAGGIATKDLYELFPNGPAKKAAKISGYPKPQGCV